MTKRLLKTKD